MKKSLFLSMAAIAASALLTGCAGLGALDGVPSPGIGCLYNESKGVTMIQQPSTNDYIVIAHNVSGKAELRNIFGLISFGNASYEALKRDAIRNAPGADDVIDVKMEYKSNNIIGIHAVEVTMTGTAIKYKK